MTSLTSSKLNATLGTYPVHTFEEQSIVGHCDCSPQCSNKGTEVGDIMGWKLEHKIKTHVKAVVKASCFHYSCECSKENLPMFCTPSFGSNCGSSLSESLTTFWRQYIQLICIYGAIFCLKNTNYLRFAGWQMCESIPC